MDWKRAAEDGGWECVCVCVREEGVRGESAKGLGCMSGQTHTPALSTARRPDQHLNNRTIVAAAADTAGLKGGRGAGFEVGPIRC